jgi:hypothetical protein
MAKPCGSERVGKSLIHSLPKPHDDGSGEPTSWCRNDALQIISNAGAQPLEWSTAREKRDTVRASRCLDASDSGTLTSFR